MFEDQYRFAIKKDLDVDISKKDFDKVDTIALDLKHNKLKKAKFMELFERLSVRKFENLEIDLREYDGLDDDKVLALIDCVRNYNLKTFILILSDINLTDDEFEGLIYKTMEKMTNLEKLHLELENINMTEIKRKVIEKILTKLKNIDTVYINLKRNKLTPQDISHISKAMHHIPNQDFVCE
jgi:hypothetical protein